MSSVRERPALISIVIPCLNEAGNVQEISHAIAEQLDGYDFEVIFVDDGSTDETLSELKSLSVADPRLQWVSFSRNFGHQNALRAGMARATGDCVITMDADMQHPPQLLRSLIEEWQVNGYDVVYTIRDDSGRRGLKPLLSRSFYGVLNRLSDISVDAGAADFRLLDRKVVDTLIELTEDPIFYRGIISWIGFRQLGVAYRPQERFAGESKYSLSKMFKLALSGVLGFSVKPLYLTVWLGLSMSALALVYGLVVVIQTVASDVQAGWPTLAVLVLFLSGVQLTTLGFIGIYVGHDSMAAKRRPPYIVKESSERA